MSNPEITEKFDTTATVAKEIPATEVRDEIDVSAILNNYANLVVNIVTSINQINKRLDDLESRITTKKKSKKR